jgi:hypothetical protein
MKKPAPTRPSDVQDGGSSWLGVASRSRSLAIAEDGVEHALEWTFDSPPPRAANTLARLPGCVAALIIGVPLFAGAFSRGAGLVLTYVTLLVAVAAIELVRCLPAGKQGAGLELALGLWFLVLTLSVVAFVKFGLGNGLAAAALTFVVADLVSFSVAALGYNRLIH